MLLRTNFSTITNLHNNVLVGGVLSNRDTGPYCRAAVPVAVGFTVCPVAGDSRAVDIQLTGADFHTSLITSDSSFADVGYCGTGQVQAVAVTGNHCAVTDSDLATLCRIAVDIHSILVFGGNRAAVNLNSSSSPLDHDSRVTSASKRHAVQDQFGLSINNDSCTGALCNKRTVFHCHLGAFSKLH